MKADWVRLGVVARAHGVRGALRVKLDHEGSRTLKDNLLVRVGDREHRVARYAGGVLTLVDVSDRDAADALRGQTLSVRRADFPDQRGLYLIDLIGAPVQHESGAPIGVVQGFIDVGPAAGAQALMVIKRAHDDVTVPYVPAIVIEASAARVVLRPPPGLLDDDAIVVPQADDEDADADDGDA